MSIKHSINPINRLYRRPHPYHGPRVPGSPIFFWRQKYDSGSLMVFLLNKKSVVRYLILDASFILDFKLKITIAVAIRSECKLSGCSLFINFYSLSYSDTDSVILSSKITFYFKLLRPAISKNQQFNIWDFRKSLQNHIIIVPLLPQPRKWTF